MKPIICRQYAAPVTKRSPKKNKKKEHKQLKIKTVIEGPDGNFEFSAELTPEQHAFLLEYAVRDLVRKGLVPFINAESDQDLSSIMPIVQVQQ